MPENAGAVYIENVRFKMSREPAAELAAAALRAAERAGLEAGTADFVIVAVPPGYADAAAGDVERAAKATELPA